MLKWLKELIKKLPGIRDLVEERNRYFSLYEEQLTLNTQLGEQYDALRNETIELSSQIMQLTDYAAQLKKETQENTIQIDKLQREAEQRLKQITLIESEKEEVINRNELLKTEAEQLHKQITLIKAEKEEAINQNELLRTEAEQLQKQCLTFEEEQNSYRSRISELNDELAKKDATLQLFNYAKRSSELSSADFWNNHYASGGNSGTGSYQHLADFKADVVNRLIQEFGISTAIEIGCGDGKQLSLIHYPSYTGVDVSPVIIEKNRASFAGCENRVFFCSLTEREKYIHSRFELGVSMDVIFHLLEDHVFQAYMDDLFTLATHYVVIYSSNHEEYTPWPEYRHRNFTGYVSEHFPQWELIRYIPNRYPYKFGSEQNTSSADFYIYKNTLASSI